MADNSKKLVTLDLLTYYDEKSKAHIEAEVEKATKTVVEEVTKSNELEII